MLISESHKEKRVYSDNYNYTFDKITGHFTRYGKDINDDPELAPSPEIADIEVTTICNGINGVPCKHCYKSNTKNGNNMSFDVFKTIFDKISKHKILTQIAFGTDSQATSNPDLLKMMHYSRNNGVIPNITVANISDDTAKQLAEVCGAVAVSRYEDKNICYDSIGRLYKYGLGQINIHLMVSEETYDICKETLQDRLDDDRLKCVRAIVLLSLKQKGRGTNYHILSQQKFSNLVDFAAENRIIIGSDSCSAYKFLLSVKKRSNFNKIEKYIESCESSLFSIFINWRGEAFPCSFSDGCEKWENGIDIKCYNDFVKEIWNHEKFVEFRNTLLETRGKNCFNCRTCPLYEV